MSALFRAVKRGDESEVRRILAESPQEVHACEREESTPLHWAAWKGHAALVDLLLDAGADIQAQNLNQHWGTSALHAAAHGNQRAVVEVLLRRGADVHCRDLEGHTPLDETKVHNATAAAKLLCAAGA